MNLLKKKIKKILTTRNGKMQVQHQIIQTTHFLLLDICKLSIIKDLHARTNERQKEADVECHQHCCLQMRSEA